MTADRIKQLMETNLTWGGSWNDIDASSQLLETGVIDSLGMVKLIGLLEEEFSIEVDDEDVVPENWSTIQSIADLVDTKLGQGR